MPSINCIFCRIISGELPGSFVYKDSQVSAFLDIHPINQGHVLIVPNEHYERLDQIPASIFSKMSLTAQEINKSLLSAGVRREGTNLFLSDGKIAGQEVPHAHLHITPRFDGDGHRMGFSNTDANRDSRGQLGVTAEKIRQALQNVNWLPERIETPRLILRALVEADAAAIFDYCRDPEVSKFTTWLPHKDLNDSKNLISYAQRNYQKHIPEPYGICLKSDPTRIVGTVGWFWVSEVHKNIEIAYALSRTLWGQGLVVEACQAILNQAMRSHDINRISSRCISENVSSAKVMEKLGMKYEGTQRQVMFVKEKFIDIKLYSVLRSEWRHQ